MYMKHKSIIKDEKGATACLQWFAKNCIVNEDNTINLIYRSTTLLLEEEIIYYALESYLNIDTNNSQQARHYLLNDVVKKWLSHVNKSETNSEFPNTLRDFANIFDETYKYHTNNRNTYHVFSVLNVQNNEFLPRTTNIRGSNFEVVDPDDFQFDLKPVWERLSDEFHIKGVSNPYFLLKFNDYKRFNESAATLFTVKVMASSAWEAILKVDDKVDSLRLALNFRSNLSVFRRLHISNRRYFCPIHPSCFYVALNESGEIKETRYPLEYIPSSTLYSLGKHDIDLGNWILETINSPKNEFDEFVYKLLHMYQTSFDTMELRHFFLGLWQLIELLVNDKPGNSVNIGARAQLLIPELNMEGILKMAPSIISQLRNRLVHRGEFGDSSEGIVNALKYIVDECLKTVLSFRGIFTDLEEYEEYLRQATDNNKTILRRKKAIDQIIKNRKINIE